MIIDKRFVCTGAAIATVMAFALILVRTPEKPPQAVELHETVSGVEIPEPSQPHSQPEYAYMLKEHEGRIAVFVYGSDEPEMVLDVPVKYLPDYDRAQMQEGIQVADYDALVALIEDYTS